MLSISLQLSHFLPDITGDIQSEILQENIDRYKNHPSIIKIKENVGPDRNLGFPRDLFSALYCLTSFLMTYFITRMIIRNTNVGPDRNFSFRDMIPRDLEREILKLDTENATS